MTRREDIAWCAGFFDGEGSVGCYDGLMYLQIEQKVEWCCEEPFSDVLERFALVFPVTTVKGPYTNRSNHSNLSTMRYVATGFEKVQYIISSMWEFLGEVKRDNYREALKKQSPKKHHRKMRYT